MYVSFFPVGPFQKAFTPMAGSQALPTVISASWKNLWKKTNTVIQVKHIMSIEMFAILERHICKDIIQFRNIYYKKQL